MSSLGLGLVDEQCLVGDLEVARSRWSPTMRSSMSSATSSSAVSSQLRYARASNNAVVPKLITIAVNTSACGIGSAKSAGIARPISGGSPRRPALTNSTLAPWLIRPRPTMIRDNLRCSSR